MFAKIYLKDKSDASIELLEFILDKRAFFIQRGIRFRINKLTEKDMKGKVVEVLKSKGIKELPIMFFGGGHFIGNKSIIGKLTNPDKQFRTQSRPDVDLDDIDVDTWMRNKMKSISGKGLESKDKDGMVSLSDPEILSFDRFDEDGDVNIEEDAAKFNEQRKQFERERKANMDSYTNRINNSLKSNDPLDFNDNNVEYGDDAVDHMQHESFADKMIGHSRRQVTMPSSADENSNKITLNTKEGGIVSFEGDDDGDALFDNYARSLVGK